MATNSDEGALRLATAALFANGGFALVLRMPGLAVSGSDAEQMGLATPEFEDVPVGPAVWRKAGATDALLLAGAPIQALMGVLGFDSVETLFQSAVAVVVDGVAYGIKGCEPVLVAGTSCAYRVTVVEPSWA